MRPKANWPALIKEQEEKQIPITKFCKERRISTSSFYQHKLRASNRPPIKNTDPDPQFVLVEPKELPVNDLNPTLRITNLQGLTLEVYL